MKIAHCSFGIGAVLIALFALRYWMALPVFDEEYLGTYRGQEVVVRGMVNAAGQVEGEGVRVQSLSRTAWGTIMLRGLSLYDAPRYGAVVEVRGVLEDPLRPDPRLAGVMKVKFVKVVAVGRGNFLVEKLIALREFLTGRLNELFPEPAASLAGGILLGARSQIPKEVTSDFKKAGVTHILAISGFNIVILISCVAALASFFSRRVGTVFTLAVIVAFTILVGASGSVIRASVMGSLSVIARFFGRKASALRTLFLTAYLMALLDPFIIFYDIGFQLSCGATAGLIVFGRRWQDRFEKFPEFLGIKECLITTNAAQVFTTPMLIYYFKGVSLVAPLANILVLPAIPWLMLGSFVSLFVGSIVAAPTWLGFVVIQYAIHFCASLPYAYWDLSGVL